ncbi:paraquat-inducible protein B [Snodgrassella communis]|uniref:Paraquat-inducible protein B n=1 Tax=Snodgrassella communis TaxID=2946699 RepID=A0A836MSB3_9NEIS|nr:intermembrane transport protein PqiB [Snodgrassella communis]KDN15343.1 Paraquat-inducible protein B [Snodgrassella communis]PIT09367.1 paraquat-inducible protein B [Snodgrassella communis]PIT26423.1 paraquat-inducible protein B [Snodgrassella communis]PIT28661.1 paraquat-inducible protein B [Snodgrassella communis]PIT31201.1 paraquat-inducible protein B [Snodgrassella communis]
MSQTENETTHTTATVKHTPPFNVLVWSIPVLALLTGAWLFIQHLRHTGPEITLYLNDADGIEINTTAIKVLNVTVGKVTSISINPDEKGVQIKAQMSADVKDMLRKDTQFWIVKPRIDQSGITGLNTLVSGSYIAFTPGHSKEKAETFTVGDLPPVSAISQSGIRLRLKGHSDKLLTPGSPVLYGDISAGQIEKAYFDPKDNSVHYQVYINSPYDSLIGDKVKFWLQSGLQVTASGGGVHIDSAPLPALLSGAIVFKTMFEGKGKPVANNTEFTLYNSARELNNQPSTRTQYYVAFFQQSVRGLSVGAPVEYLGINIGSVADVPYFAMNDSHKLFQHGWIPVRLRIEPGRMEINASRQDDKIWQQQIQQALNKGLSASLEKDNLLTGNQYISLTQAKSGESLLKPITHYQGYTVIGTRHTGLDMIQDQLSALLAKLNNLPIEHSMQQLDGTLAQLKTTLASADRLLAQNKTQQLPAELNATLKELRTTLQGVSSTSPLYGDIQQTLKNIDNTLKEAQPTLKTLKQQPNALIFNRHGHDPEPQGAR